MRLWKRTVLLIIIFAAGVIAHAVEPLEIMFVLDNSGSMKTNDPDFRTRNFVAEFIDNAPPEARVGMVIFDNEPHLIMPLTTVTEPDIRERVKKGLNHLTYTGQWTRSPAAIERALYTLKHSGSSHARRVIIFITDGLVDTGDPAKDRERSEWLRENLTADARQNGIRMFCIAFTESADYQLLQILAQKTGGEYYRAMKIEDIQGVLSSVNKRMTVAATPTPAAGSNVSTPSPADLMVTILNELNSRTGLTIAGIFLVFLLLILLLMRRRQPAPQIIMAPDFSGTGRGFKAPPQPPAGGERKQPTDISRDDSEKDDPMWRKPESEPATTDPPPKTVSEKPESPAASDPPSREPTHPIPERGGRGKLPPAILEDLGNVTAQAVYNLDKYTVRIGRNENLNDIVIPERTVSKQHAVIEFIDNMFILKDLRSANGTTLNHRKFSDPGKVTETPLKNGDRIAFDVFEFQFLVDDAKPVDRTLLRPIDYAPPKNPNAADLPAEKAVTTQQPVAEPAADDGEDVTIRQTTLLTRDLLEEAVSPAETASGIADTTDEILLEDRTFISDDGGDTESEPAVCYNHPERIGRFICDICAHSFCRECIQEDTAGCVCKACARLI